MDYYHGDIGVQHGQPERNGDVEHARALGLRERAAASVTPVDNVERDLRIRTRQADEELRAAV